MNPRSLGFLIFYALVAGMLALIFTACEKSPNKWEVVCDENGNYSYVDGYGQVNEDIYLSRELALLARDHAKVRSDYYDRRKREVESHKWKACPSNAAPGKPKRDAGITVSPNGSVTIEIPLFIPSPTATPTPQELSL